MIPGNPVFRRYIITVFLVAAVAGLVLIGGCTQAGTPSAEQNKFIAVTAAQPDASHIVITYQGGPDMEKILELETVVTSSHGISKTQSAGSRLATTPITIRGTNTVEGAFEGQDHVVVTGFFSDGSRRVLLDTTV